MFTNASKCLATPRAILSTCSRPRAHTVSIANTKVPKCTIFSVAPAPRRTCVSLQDTYTLRLPYRFPSSSQPSRRHISSAQDGAIKEKHRAFIALGSNMGDRVAMIERACRELESNGKVDIIQTSSLWESKAMYVVNQDNFVNGACEIETQLSPIELLDELQRVEKKMDRVKIIDKGPRNIDLDILFYGSTEYSDERLQIPHPLMFEREFVLRPLIELLPKEPNHFPFKDKVRDHLERLPAPDVPLVPMTPLAPDLSPISSVRLTNNTRVMSILNLTPDSFSDGGQNYRIDEATLANTIRAHIADGATIIDVGGQSTRPGAVQVSAEEELARVLPAVKLIRSLPEAENVAISVDTYRGSVAEETIAAGANMINDVSAGAMDDAMLSTMGKLGCTVCLMHMRGTPETMTRPEMTSYPDGIVETVGRELLERVYAAEKAGVRRWRIVLDPGIGFAKTQAHNLELLRRQDELMKYPGLEGMPWLVGTSRKAFIGHITGVKTARDRIWGTAVAISAAVKGGAQIVRVHDVKEMTQTVKMADTLWRT